MMTYVRPEPPSPTAFPLARAGYPFIFTGAFVTVVFALLELRLPAVAALVVTLFIAYFFRDPDRVVPDQPGALVSPADGKVISVGQVEKSPFGQERCMRISIFMSIFNVHVNRMPHEGTVKEVRYQPGRFFAANQDRASERNEQNAVLVHTDGQRKIEVVQVAGLVARRIICGLAQGDTVVRGQRFGMICFGSRLDVYLPQDTLPKVTPGQRVKAGNSILGILQ